MKYLDENGLLYLLQQIKGWLNSKVDKVNGKGLSTNDYTTTEKNKLAGLENYSLPTASTETLGGVKVGAGLTINSGVLSATGGGMNSALDIYPVGSIYLSVNNTNPNTLFGGTWEQIKDRFLLACGNTYSNGSTGGEANHTLTVNEMPSHKHSFSRTAGSIGDAMCDDGANSTWGSVIGNTAGSYTAKSCPMNESGGGQAHNNMPPYLAVYMWKRTA